jgi:lysophospholipase L1-like esterase
MDPVAKRSGGLGVVRRSQLKTWSGPPEKNKSFPNIYNNHQINSSTKSGDWNSFSLGEKMLGTSTDVILCFGDSITQQGYNSANVGWVASLSDAYIRKLNVINAGLSGYNTEKALKVLPQIIPSESRMRVMIIFFGANDARLLDPEDAAIKELDQHVPQEVFEANLLAIINDPSVQAHKPRIVLVTPPPIDEDMCQSNELASKGIQHPRHLAAVTYQYSEVVCRIAKADQSIALANVWSAFAIEAGEDGTGPLLGTSVRQGGSSESNARLSSLLRDGLHLTAKGNKVVFLTIQAAIMQKWPELDPEQMRFVLPYWADEEAWKDW